MQQDHGNARRTGLQLAVSSLVTVQELDAVIAISTTRQILVATHPSDKMPLTGPLFSPNRFISFTLNLPIIHP